MSGSLASEVVLRGQRDAVIESAESVGSLRVHVSSAASDPLWDEFLAETPCGHHTQSSHWAGLKGTYGWRVLRTILHRGPQIIAGAQMLTRDVTRFGAVGYVPKGPVFRAFSPELARIMMRAIEHAARREHLDAVVIHPANDGMEFAGLISKFGFKLCPLVGLPTATVSIDLTRDLDTLLKRMSDATRRDIGRKEKNGITVRNGTAKDLPMFHRLLSITAKRHGFEPESIGYLQTLWSLLQPSSGHVALFLSEYQGDAVSGQLVIGFGDTVIAKRFGWNGKHSKLGPNVVLDWATICWAKANGYKRYDLDGIERKVAELALAGAAIPDGALGRYKLKLGGDVTLLPQAYCWWRNPVFAKAWGAFGPRLLNWKALQYLARRLRSA